MPAWQYGVADGSPQNQRRRVVVRLPYHAGDRRTVAPAHGSPQIRVRQRIDLQREQSSPAVVRSPLARKRAVLEHVVQPQQRARPREAPPLDEIGVHATHWAAKPSSSRARTGLRITSTHPALPTSLGQRAVVMSGERHGDARRGARGRSLGEDIETVPVGQRQVEQHEVGPMAGACGDGLGHRRCHSGAVAAGLEEQPERIGRQRMIFDDEDIDRVAWSPGQRRRCVHQATSRSMASTSCCRRSNAQYRPPSASSSSCRPCSTTRPSSSTTIQVASRIALIRCDAMMAVRPDSALAQSAQDLGLGVGVDGRQRVVEQDDGRAPRQRARQRGALLLAARQIDAALAQHGVVTAGELAIPSHRVARRGRPSARRRSLPVLETGPPASSASPWGAVRLARRPGLRYGRTRGWPQWCR